MRVLSATLGSLLLVACASSPAAPPPEAPLPPPAAAPAPAAPAVPAELTGEMIQPTIGEMEKAAFGCYTLEFAGQELDGGSLVVELVIEPTGTVASASIAESSFASETFASCVLEAAKQLRFPAAQRGTALRKPLSFRREAEPSA